MTIAAYETLYESSIAYGVRKALVAEQKKVLSPCTSIMVVFIKYALVIPTAD